MSTPAPFRVPSHPRTLHRLLKAQGLPLARQVHAVAHYAQQAGARSLAVHFREKNPNETVVTVSLDRPLAADAATLFPYLHEGGDPCRPAALGLATLAADGFQVTSRDPDTGSPWQALFDARHLTGAAVASPRQAPDKDPILPTRIRWTVWQPVKCAGYAVYDYLPYQKLPFTYVVDGRDDYEEGAFEPLDYLENAVATGCVQDCRIGLFTSPDVDRQPDTAADNVNYCGEPHHLELPELYTEDNVVWHARLDVEAAGRLVTCLRDPGTGGFDAIYDDLKRAVCDFLDTQARTQKRTRFSDLSKTQAAARGVRLP